MLQGSKPLPLQSFNCRCLQVERGGIQLILVPNRTGAGDMFLDPLRVAGIGNFSRAGDGNFQCFAGPNLGVRRARGGDFGGFGLKTARG